MGAEVRLAQEPTPEAILEVAREADALLTTYAKIPAEMIAQMKRCRIIARFGIGVDNVDIPAATKAGIVVTRVPDYCLDEVSDHAMALLLALARKIPSSNARTHAGQWAMKAVVPIHRLRGAVLGLVAFGQIARLVARKGGTVWAAGGDLRSLCAAGSPGARRRGRGTRLTSWWRSPTTFPFTPR